MCVCVCVYVCVCVLFFGKGKIYHHIKKNIKKNKKNGWSTADLLLADSSELQELYAILSFADYKNQKNHI